MHITKKLANKRGMFNSVLIGDKATQQQVKYLVSLGMDQKQAESLTKDQAAHQINAKINAVRAKQGKKVWNY